MAEICVVGAGPAGSVFAARMAQLGHDVRLIEQARFPRSRLGEYLTPGVEPLLNAARLEAAIDLAGAKRVRRVRVDWADGSQWREDPREKGFIVDRGLFDLALVNRVRAFGVDVRQPARVIERRRANGRWRLTIDVDGRAEILETDFLAEANGRGGGGSRGRRTGSPTLALFAYWRSGRPPATPRIEAGDEAWFWIVPLPNGVFNTLAFVDPKTFRSAGEILDERFLSLLARSSLVEDCRGAEREGSVQAVDATPWLSDDLISVDAIRLGDAAAAIDPISSSGVQKAIQGALAGAIVANTLLRKPERADDAMRFYRGRLSDAFERHRRWAAERYAAVAKRRAGKFWDERARGLEPETVRPPAATADVRMMAASPVELSPKTAFVGTPSLGEEFVDVVEAVSHPNLAGPVAYLGGVALTPLLRTLPAGRTPLEIARAWTERIPLETGLAIAGWLVNHGVLVRSERLE